MAELQSFNQEVKLTSANPSKQLNYYYRHKLDRLAYQKAYYQKNKSTILTKKQARDQLSKVKRTNKNITLSRSIHNLLLSYGRQICNTPYDREQLFHCHGRPRRKFNVYKNKMWFHMKGHKEISMQICHALGFKFGTSIVWHSVNQYTKKTETNFLSFDGSGLDISHESNLPLLQSIACETGLKGENLLFYLKKHYSKDGYLQVYKGSKLWLTSEPKNALKDYLRANYAF